MRSDVNTFQNRLPERMPLERSAQARAEDGTRSSPAPLSQYSDVPAWVLIADPGAGKTDVFRTLSEAEGGCYSTARDFLALLPPAGQSGPIFIDGLDEMTAGNAAGST